jgi:orotate phosphoribosyltransferase
MNGQLDLARELAQRGALLEGHFRLSSGRHSNRFVQKFRILEDPRLLEAVAREIAGYYASTQPTVVVSAAVGGILLGYEVARALGTKAIFVEKQDGVPTMRRGFVLHSSDRALIVEDVITTGGSVREVVEVVRASGATIVGIGAIVLRGDAHGGASAAGAHDVREAAEARFDVPFMALLEVPIVSVEAADCAQCAAGEPIADPGSRRA